MFSTVIPTVIAHLWSVKGWAAAPNLALPKIMPADVKGTVDMEKVEPSLDSTPYWIAMAEGVARMLFPTALAKLDAGVSRDAWAIFTTVVIVVFLGTLLLAFWP